MEAEKLVFLFYNDDLAIKISVNYSVATKYLYYFAEIVWFHLVYSKWHFHLIKNLKQ